MPNLMEERYREEAYVAGFDGYWNGHMQPPSDMPSAEKEYWYRGYTKARRADEGDYDE